MNKQSRNQKKQPRNNLEMANRSRIITMSPLVLNQEDDLDLDLWEVVNHSDGEYSDDSFSVDSLSDDDVISLDDASFVSPSVVSPPPEMLPEADGGELAADLDLDGYVGGDDDCVNFSHDEVDGDGKIDNVFRDGDGELDEVDIDGELDNVFGDEVDDNDLGWAHRRMVILRRGTVVGVRTYGDYVNRHGGCYDDGEEDRGGDDGEYDDSYDLDDELLPRSASKKLGRQRMRKVGKRAIAKASKTSPYSHLKSGCVRGKYCPGMKIKY